MSDETRREERAGSLPLYCCVFYLWLTLWFAFYMARAAETDSREHRTEQERERTTISETRGGKRRRLHTFACLLFAALLQYVLCSYLSRLAIFNCHGWQEEEREQIRENNVTRQGGRRGEASAGRYTFSFDTYRFTLCLSRTAEADITEQGRRTENR